VSDSQNFRLLSESPSFWKWGLVPQSIANGLSSILLLVFLVTGLHGGLLEIGLLAGLSALALIPSQMFWGWLIDKTSRCKPFLVLSFAATGLVYFAIPWVTSISGLLVVAIVKSVFYGASLPARQVLTVESERRERWQGGLARLQLLTGMGETIGMGIGALTISSAGFGTLFLSCGGLCLVSALGAGLLARDPQMMIQRRLVGMERYTSTLVLASNILAKSGVNTRDLTPGRVARMLNPGTRYLMVGIFAFSLGGATLYSPLPAYFLNLYSSSTVFLLFFAGSLANTICYLLVGRVAKSAQKSLLITPLLRMVLIPLLILPALGAGSSVLVAAAVLAPLSGVWALFDVSSAFAYLEVSQIGQAGLYGALIGLGSAAGGFFGGFVSVHVGFPPLFAICSAIYATSLVTFALQFRK
jgi:predicted MFS family arabinose efflux permease